MENFMTRSDLTGFVKLIGCYSLIAVVERICKVCFKRDVSHAATTLRWIITLSATYNIFSLMKYIAFAHAGCAIYGFIKLPKYFHRYICMPGVASCVIPIVYKGAISSPNSISLLFFYINRDSLLVAIAAYLIQTGFVVNFIIKLLIYPAPLVSALTAGDNGKKVSKTTLFNTNKSNAHYTSSTNEALPTLPRNWHRIFVKSSHCNVHIECAVYTNPMMSNTGERESWIFYIGGNGSILEHSTMYLSVMADQLNFNHVLCYNSRGVGLSGGTIQCATDLIEDASNVLEMLLSNKYVSQTSPVKSKNILLYGHSIGGAILTQLINKFNIDLQVSLRDKNKFEFGVVIDRSFNYLSKTAYQVTGIPSLPLVKATLECTFGEFNSVQIYNNYINQHRQMQHKLNACTIDRKYNVLFIFHRKDQIIDYVHCSIVPSLNNSALFNYLEIRQELSDPHNMPITCVNEFGKFTNIINSMF